MSQSSTKEKKESSLQQVSPSITALIIHLTQENNGTRVYEKRKIRSAENDRDVHVMSNGSSYSMDDLGKWYVI
jgi:hypothetical protein